MPLASRIGGRGVFLMRTLMDELSCERRGTRGNVLRMVKFCAQNTSLNDCRMSRARLAPIAARMPISFWWLTLRVNNRLATLAQAINSTRPTAAMSSMAN